MIFIFYFDFTKQSALFEQNIHKYHPMYSFQTLITKIQSSKPIDFGDLFNASLNLFKKVWVQGLLDILETICQRICKFYIGMKKQKMLF